MGPDSRRLRGVVTEAALIAAHAKGQLYIFRHTGAGRRMPALMSDAMRRLDFVGDLDRNKIVPLDFATAEFRQQAHRLVADWATRPPFYVLGKGPPQVIVGRYADVHEVFSDAERFASELPKGPGYEQYDKFMGLTFLTQTDGAQHARLRRLLVPAFSAHRMEQIESSITAIVEGMLDDIERTGPEFDGMAQYGAKLVIGALVSTMMGLNEEQQQVLIDYQEVLPLATARKPGEPYPVEYESVARRTAELVEFTIAERRAGHRADFLNDLVQARDRGDKLSDEELFGMIYGLFGSIAATSRSAGGALYTLYSHPGELAQLIREPALIPDAVEECLRIASNGYFTFARIATRDTEVGGTPIYEGMIVRPSPLAANYDPLVYPHPQRFDIHASRSGSCRSLWGRIFVSAIFLAAPRSRLRSNACSAASRRRGLPIPISCRSMAARLVSCACSTCRCLSNELDCTIRRACAARRCRVPAAASSCRRRLSEPADQVDRALHAWRRAGHQRQVAGAETAGAHRSVGLR
jgi:cytochrome P450